MTPKHGGSTLAESSGRKLSTVSLIVICSTSAYGALFSVVYKDLLHLISRDALAWWLVLVATLVCLVASLMTMIRFAKLSESVPRLRDGIWIGYAFLMVSLSILVVYFVYARTPSVALESWKLFS